MGCKDVNWIQVFQDRANLSYLLNMVMQFRAIDYLSDYYFLKMNSVTCS